MIWVRFQHSNHAIFLIRFHLVFLVISECVLIYIYIYFECFVQNRPVFHCYYAIVCGPDVETTLWGFFVQNILFLMFWLVEAALASIAQKEDGEIVCFLTPSQPWWLSVFLTPGQPWRLSIMCQSEMKPGNLSYSKLFCYCTVCFGECVCFITWLILIIG